MTYDTRNPNPTDPGPIYDPAYTDPERISVEPYAGQPGLPTFPTWPPPSGGAPVLTPELGPITNPFPYGGGQTANISTAPPSPVHPYSSTFYPKKMPPLNGQNQKQSLPTWPHAKFNTLPDKASPSLSKLP